MLKAAIMKKILFTNSSPLASSGAGSRLKFGKNNKNPQLNAADK
jgi:hypothetical protein